MKPLLLLLTVAAAQPQQFDLVCTGRLATGAPITERYHIDLATNQWCKEDGCTIKPLAEVNNTQIVFEQTNAAYPGDPSRSLDYADRTTGKWAFFNRIWTGEGACTPAPFGGFPTPTTKF